MLMSGTWNTHRYYNGFFLSLTCYQKRSGPHRSRSLCVNRIYIRCMFVPSHRSDPIPALHSSFLSTARTFVSPWLIAMLYVYAGFALITNDDRIDVTRGPVSKLISKRVKLLFLWQPSKSLSNLLMVQEGSVTSGNVLSLHARGIVL